MLWASSHVTLVLKGFAQLVRKTIHEGPRSPCCFPCCIPPYLAPLRSLSGDRSFGISHELAGLAPPPMAPSGGRKRSDSGGLSLSGELPPHPDSDSNKASPTGAGGAPHAQAACLQHGAVGMRLPLTAERRSGRAIVLGHVQHS